MSVKDLSAYELVKEEDLKLIDIMHAKINEEIADK